MFYIALVCWYLKFDDSPRPVPRNVHNLIIFSHHISFKTDNRAYRFSEPLNTHVKNVSNREEQYHDAFPSQARYISTAHSTFHVHVFGGRQQTKRNNNGVNSYEYDE